MSEQKLFILNDKVRKSINSFLSCIEGIPIHLSKDLFFPHMINSYHGIAHTARVTLISHILFDLSGIPENERTASYVAAIVHDLGKRNDREGSVHGYNSMVLFKDRVSAIFDNQLLVKRVLNAIRYHSVDDINCPLEVRADSIWKILKDADAMDRGRFFGKGCDKSYLRLNIYNALYGQNILDFAKCLPAWTSSLKWDKPYEELINRINYCCV